MKPLRVFETPLYALRKKHAKRKRQQREQIAQSVHPSAHHKILTHQHHVAGLGIGEDLLPRIIGIGILKSSGDRQKNTGQKCL